MQITGKSEKIESTTQTLGILRMSQILKYFQRLNKLDLISVRKTMVIEKKSNI